MIWPEFETETKDVLVKGGIPVPRTGTARMWVTNANWRDYHSNKLHKGLKGYFMEGPIKVAECEVIEFIGLETNPR